MIYNFFFFYIILFSVSFLCTKKLIPFALYFGSKFGILDIPNKRKKQLEPVVRFGGLSILITLFFVAFLGYLFINYYSDAYKFKLFWPIIFGSFLFYLIGSSDDFLNLRPLPRLFSQFLCASYICSNGLIIEKLDVSFLGLQNQFIDIPKSLSILFTVIWIVGVTNSINWIDGLDGLATGVSFLILFGILIISFFSGNQEVLILTCILTGSCLAFLLYNSFPAKIYLGDGGSYLLGFMISTLSLFSLNSQSVNPISVILIVLLPVIDMCRVIFLRILSKNSPFFPDRKHLHHLIVDSGIDHKNTVYLLYGITLFFVIMAVIVGISTLD